MGRGELVVDVRGYRVECLEDFRDAIRAVEPRVLPRWQGRSLDALWDTIENRGVSDFLDAHEVLVVRADRAGLFAEGSPGGAGLCSVFADATRARLELFDRVAGR
ncbi:hypothetical protein ACFVGM_36230 [Kitasatospora purpeofusca]|uniref:hypothetical protein n=1 Tax=Kitasatospora purpeofusca TaxID=67352 RepID=UPI0036A49F17